MNPRMYRVYENEIKENEIRVYDEVECNEERMIVTKIDSFGNLWGITYRGGLYIRLSPQSWKRTGRTFPQLAELLEQLKGE